ncbi:MAG: DUF2470 domain-containing protein [Pseudonocardiaceae bacterium]
MSTTGEAAGVPGVAERARSIAQRGGSATVLPGSGSSRLVPLQHHVGSGGDTLVVLPEEHSVIIAARAAPRHELPAMVELADNAPVSLRQPVRGLLWITGWLRPLDPDAARAAAVTMAERRPDPRLLDIGHGARVLRLHAASIVLADGEGTESVPPEEFTRAAPDPFCGFERAWLRHLEDGHPDVFSQLLRHIPASLRHPAARVRPLGLDRFGLRLRVEVDSADRDIRLCFSRPVMDTGDLGREIKQLLGCPFLSR